MQHLCADVGCHCAWLAAVASEIYACRGRVSSIACWVLSAHALVLLPAAGWSMSHLEVH